MRVGATFGAIVAAGAGAPVAAPAATGGDDVGAAAATADEISTPNAAR